MRDVLFVSKPVAPPWNDSNKNLVRDIARALKRYRARVMVPKDQPLPGAYSERVYASSGTYAPSRVANARVLARLVFGPQVKLWHFFFTPNPMTLRAGRVASRLRRVRTVHTIASAPDDLETVAPWLFADRIVALSCHTAARLARVGISAVTIPPAMETPRVSREAIIAARARYGLPERYVLFPGDLEFGDGARTFLRAAALAPEVGWVVASRPKTSRAHQVLRALQAEAMAAGVPIVWLGEVQDIHAVVAGASVVALVTNTLHAKMDWPLVLLEALTLGVPVLVAQDTAAAELHASGGVSVVPHGDPEALVAAVRQWLTGGEVTRERMDQAARWVRQRCDPSEVARAYEALYDELLGLSQR